MKFTSFKAVCLVTVLFCMFSPPSYSQDSPRAAPGVIQVNPPAPEKKDSVVLKTADSTTQTVATKDITAPSNTSLFGWKLPAWLFPTLIAILTSLAGAQATLKRTPGASPFQGIIGIIGNILTAFQKNVADPNDPKKDSKT